MTSFLIDDSLPVCLPVCLPSCLFVFVCLLLPGLTAVRVLCDKRHLLTQVSVTCGGLGSCGIS